MDPTQTATHALSNSTTTPIRRRPSRGSLSALALSASRSRIGDAPPLTHLSAFFSELADDIQDVTANFERLNALNDSLDTFNEAFASLLYGLKMNAFCDEFVQAPTASSFEYAERRAAAAEALAAARVSSPRSTSPTPSATASEPGPDAAVQSVPGDRGLSSARGGALSRSRGRGTGAARGRAVAAKRKERRLAFASELLRTLPIKFREEQPHRHEMESVILALRDQPAGLHIPEIVKATNVPNHRVNEACLALVRAKHALKIAQNVPLQLFILSKRLTIVQGLLFKLDPTRYPAEAD